MLHLHSHALVSNKNPLRKDPTRTTGIQLRFIALIRSRLRWLIVQIRDFIDTADALALRDRPLLRLAATPRQFEFQTDSTKLEAFNKWLERQIKEGVLNFADQNKKLITAAYKRGQINAYLSSKASQFADELGVQAKSQEEFLRRAFNNPETLGKIQFLATRSFEQLKGITTQMSADMNRILSDGMAQGKNPRTIAREMAKKISGISKTRAVAIARSELVRAHADGQLAAFKELGVEELGVIAEFTTAGDGRVCSRCLALEGRTFDLEEAKGVIPVHTMCRCSWTPVERKRKSKKRKK